MSTSTRYRLTPLHSYTVSKRLAAHQAKFPQTSETGLSRYTPRSTRTKQHVSYTESSDEEEEEGDDDDDSDEEEYEDVEETQPTSYSNSDPGSEHDSDSDSDSDIQEISAEQFKASVSLSTSVSRPVNKPVKKPVNKLVNKPVSKPVESASAKLFKNLATEIHQLIAECLPTDYDIAIYALVCKTTGAAITPSVWRKRFLCTFDFDDSFTTARMIEKYKYRRIVSRQWACFDLKTHGLGLISYEVEQIQITNQLHCLDMLKSLILDSNARLVRDNNGQLVVRGLNLQFIQDIITGNNGMSYVDIIDSVFRTNYDEIVRIGSGIRRNDNPAHALYIVQLCLAAFSLHPKFSKGNVKHFDASQYQVYSSPSTQPIFLDKWKQSVNTRWLLHVVNFFKYHFKTRGEGLLSHDYVDLDADQYPQPWVGKIRNGTQPLGTHWKGAYTYLEQHTLWTCRSGKPADNTVYPDSLDGGETFQDMSFFFNDSQCGNDKWPKEWENILGSDPFKHLDNHRVRNRSNQRDRPIIKQFWGTSRGSKQGHFFGRIHALIPQAGVPGFQRLVMMKFCTKVENGQSVYDPSQVWAYEGCVLPGGRIIAGRWWDASGDVTDEGINSGPFLWWMVDRSSTDRPIDESEAFDFLDSFQDHDMGVV